MDNYNKLVAAASNDVPQVNRVEVWDATEWRQADGLRDRFLDIRGLCSDLAGALAKIGFQNPRPIASGAGTRALLFEATCDNEVTKCFRLVLSFSSTDSAVLHLTFIRNLGILARVSKEIKTIATMLADANGGTDGGAK